MRTGGRLQADLVHPGGAGLSTKQLVQQLEHALRRIGVLLGMHVGEWRPRFLVILHERLR